MSVQVSNKKRSKNQPEASKSSMKRGAGGEKNFKDDKVTSKRKSVLARKSSDMSDFEGGDSDDEVISDEEVSRAQERLKEAKRYLEDLTEEAKSSKKQRKAEVSKDSEDDEEAALPFDEFDAEDIDRELIASRLQKDTLVSRGRGFEAIAESFKGKSFVQFACKTADGRVPTGCAMGPDSIVYLITKGNCVYQYKIQQSQQPQPQPQFTLQKLHTFRPTGMKDLDSFCSIAVSSCGKFVAAGTKSGKIVVWSVNASASKSTNFTYKQLTIFAQHRGAIYSLAFRRDDLTLYSASVDRTVKVWLLSGEPVYIDTLFGHQDAIMSISALSRETCISVGARDRSVRLWKVAEESQLVFRAEDEAGGSQECVTMLDEDTYVSGSDTGALSLWNSRKKRAIQTQLAAHSGNNPIGALAAQPFTNLLASGAGDGFIRLWRAAASSSDAGSAAPLCCVRELPCAGFVNGLVWSEDGHYLVAAVGKEQRLGRWEIQKSHKNQAQVFFFP